MIISKPSVGLTITIKSNNLLSISNGSKEVSVGYSVLSGRKAIQLDNHVQYVGDLKVLVRVFEELYDNSEELAEMDELIKAKKTVNGFNTTDEEYAGIQAMQEPKKEIKKEETKTVSIDEAIEFFNQEGSVNVRREMGDYSSDVYVTGNGSNIIYQLGISKKLDGGTVSFETIKNILIQKKDEDSKKTYTKEYEAKKSEEGDKLISIRPAEEGENYIYQKPDGSTYFINMS